MSSIRHVQCFRFYAFIWEDTLQLSSCFSESSMSKNWSRYQWFYRSAEKRFLPAFSFQVPPQSQHLRLRWTESLALQNKGVIRLADQNHPGQPCLVCSVFGEYLLYLRTSCDGHTLTQRANSLIAGIKESMGNGSAAFEMMKRAGGHHSDDRACLY